jgi:hypothetical protein
MEKRPRDSYVFLPSGTVFKENNLKVLQIIFEGKKVQIDIEEELKIDPFNLQGSILLHMENYGWWVSLHASVNRNINLEKRDLEFLLDRLSIEGVSVSKLKEYTSHDPRVRQLKQRVSDLEDLKSLSEDILEAFEHKRDMLKLLASIKKA